MSVLGTVVVVSGLGKMGVLGENGGEAWVMVSRKSHTERERERERESVCVYV